MNVEHLQTFVAIVELGSLSAAARVLHISQPAVTKQIQRLEQELETTVLVRGPKQRAVLTPAGEQVLAFARETLGRFEGLQEQLALLKSVGGGSLAVAASTIPGEYLLPGLVAAFRAQYPQVQVQVGIADTTEVAGRIVADEADVGFMGAAVDKPGLRLERLAGDEIVLVVPPDHPFAGRAAVAPHELAGQAMVLREEGSGTRYSVEQAFVAAGAGVPAWDVALTMGSSQAVLQAAGQGLGIGFVSERAVAQQQADGHLASTRITGLDLRRDLFVAYLPQRMAEPLIAHFLAFVRSRLAP